VGWGNNILDKSAALSYILLVQRKARERKGLSDQQFFVLLALMLLLAIIAAIGGIR
jgi:hypothetical protein